MFILWNLTKTINWGFYIRFTNICNYIDSKIFFFRIWGFRGIGNIWGGFLFWGIGGWRENRTDIHPFGFRLLLGRRKRKQFYRRIRRPMKLFYFLVWSSENGIREKRRGLLQNFVDDVWVFQSRWCFGFVCDLAKWNESGKDEVPIYYKPRGFLIKLKRNPAWVWSGKVCFLKGLQTNGHGNRNLMKKMSNTLLISILRGLF